MSVTEIEHDREPRDGSVSGVPSRARDHEPRVVDFYRSITSPFFGAVVSRRDDEFRGSGHEGSRERQHWPTLVTLVGELDLSTAPLLDECLADIVGDLNIDCSGLDFIGAPGMQCLVAAHARAQQAGARLVIVEPPSSLLRLLRLAGVDAPLQFGCVEGPPRDGGTRTR
jgi:anti-anti-sigma factor